MFHFAAGAGATLGTTLLALHWFRQRNQRSRVLQSQQRPVTTTQQVTLPQTRTQPPSVPPAIPPPLLPPPPPPLAPHTADWFRPIPGVDYSATTFNPYRIRCHGYSDGPDYPFRIYVYDRSKDGGLVRWVNDSMRLPGTHGQMLTNMQDAANIPSGVSRRLNANFVSFLRKKWTSMA